MPANTVENRLVFCGSLQCGIEGVKVEGSKVALTTEKLLLCPRKGKKQSKDNRLQKMPNSEIS